MNEPTLLRRALLGNATFSALSAAVFLLGSQAVGSFLGDVPAALVATIGANLAVFCALLVWLARQDVPHGGWVRAVVAADLGWVAGTVGVVAAGLLAPQGVAAAMAVAAIVAVFAALQWTGLRQAERSAAPKPA